MNASSVHWQTKNSTGSTLRVIGQWSCWSPIRIKYVRIATLESQSAGRIASLRSISWTWDDFPTSWDDSQRRNWPTTHNHCEKHKSCARSRWNNAENLVLPKGLGLGSKERDQNVFKHSNIYENILQIFTRDPNHGWRCKSYIIHDCWFCHSTVILVNNSWVFTLIHCS